MAVDRMWMEMDNDEPGKQAASQINVGLDERRLSLLGGVVLLLLGLRQRGPGGILLMLLGGGMAFRGATGRSLIYDRLGVNTAVGKYGDGVSVPHEQGIRIEDAITIGRPRAELYAFWRDFTNLPRFMDNVEAVEILDEMRSRWTVKGPAGTTLSWDAEIVNDVPDEKIAWRSLDNAQIANAGTVEFKDAPAGRGTEVHVVMEYAPPAGQLGALVARATGREPKTQVRQELRRFKSLMETGETPTIEGQTSGREKVEAREAQERERAG
ncbi:MAG: SRPBCC family protein [Anaerolineae bacterium]|nr:SRPBCC family protein [Anaerolineae bacterium]